MSGDYRDDRGRPDLDRDGVPLPTEPPGELAEVFPLHPPTAASGLAAQPGRGLLVEDLAAVLARVQAAGPPAWLIEGVWPRDAYGVFAAEDKAGKTWAILDLAVSVAAGVPWLGHFGCPPSGPVLIFLGEGGERAMVRRLQAICAHKHLDLAELAARRLLRLCLRVPKLTSGEELQAVAGELHAHPAALVILDPLYLAVAGAATGADLYAMGAVLSGIQGVCQAAGAALVVVTHWNKTGEGRGAKRISGVGPGAWGRVLASAGVAHRASGPDGTSTVVLSVDVIGGELADLAFRVRRQVRAKDPADLASPLHYAVEVLPEEPDDLEGAAGDLKPSRRWVLAALRAGGAMQSVAQLGDRTAADGHQLKARTIQEALLDLEAAGLAAGTDPAVGLARYWSAAHPNDRAAVPGHGDDGGDP
jgi:AAA domain